MEKEKITEHYKKIYLVLEHWIYLKEFEKACKFMDLLTGMEIKMAMILTKGLEESPELKDARKKMVDRYYEYCETQGFTPV